MGIAGYSNERCYRTINKPQNLTLTIKYAIYLLAYRHRSGKP